MKEFFKFTLATITGIIVSSVVLFFVSILILFSMLSSSESETQVRKNSVMMLDMRGMLSERSQDNPFDIFLSEDETTYGLDDILSSIQKAKENEKPCQPHPVPEPGLVFQKILLGQGAICKIRHGRSAPSRWC